jgi:hypothetical protein
MAKLNKTESAQVMAIMDKPGWTALLKLVSATVSDLNSREATGENEFQVLRSLFTKQGQAKALTEFFNDLESGSSLSGERQ